MIETARHIFQKLLEKASDDLRRVTLFVLVPRQSVLSRVPLKQVADGDFRKQLELTVPLYRSGEWKYEFKTSSTYIGPGSDGSSADKLSLDLEFNPWQASRNLLTNTISYGQTIMHLMVSAIVTSKKAIGYSFEIFEPGKNGLQSTDDFVKLKNEFDLDYPNVIFTRNVPVTECERERRSDHHC